jgi:hypothetical protein
VSFPESFPFDLGGDSPRTFTWIAAMLDACPPWLRRTRGAALMMSFGYALDTFAQRAAESVRLRFPGFDSDALAIHGRERRIQRGPLEPDEAYAARLWRWRQSHRNRGGPYALLRQLEAYHAEEPRQIDVVYHSGTRRWMDVAGTITRDAIIWGADGSALWAQVWLFHHLDEDPGLLSADEEEQYRVVPREWNAAHVLPIHVVVLRPGGRLWDYPQPVPTWDAQGAQTWAELDAAVPILIEAE